MRVFQRINDNELRGATYIFSKMHAERSKGGFGEKKVNDRDDINFAFFRDKPVWNTVQRNTNVISHKEKYDRYFTPNISLKNKNFHLRRENNKRCLEFFLLQAEIFGDHAMQPIEFHSRHHNLTAAQNYRKPWKQISWNMARIHPPTRNARSTSIYMGRIFTQPPPVRGSLRR